MRDSSVIEKTEAQQHVITLPEPVYKSETSVEEAMLKRRSVRDFKDEPLELTQIGQLLWAAQGITYTKLRRTIPSAGALYPLEIYLVSGNVKSLDAGVYSYQPVDHTLTLIKKGDKRNQLSAAALMQEAPKKAPATIVIAVDYHRTTTKYLKKGNRFVNMEVGHSAQNIYLQAVSLKLGVVCMGAFIKSLVKEILQLPKKQEPLYLIPVGICE
ncbi:MAG TPA: SagB/ThcOx family dehydrogenase [Chitinophagaceae bacterium]|nr:SagB/ThcOx family dehydrogenase [Chitinophagaceae bacterium]